MLEMPGFNIHIVVYDADGNLLWSGEFPNALDSVCGCHVWGTQIVATGLSTGRIYFVDSDSASFSEDVEIWGVLSRFHQIQPLLDGDGNPIKVTLPAGAGVYINAFPKQAYKANPVQPVSVQVRTAFLGQSAPITASLYWTTQLLTSATKSVTIFGNNTYRYQTVELVRMSDVRVGASYYCRAAFQFDINSDESIAAFEFNDRIRPPMRVVFSSPLAWAVQNNCSLQLFLKPIVVVDIPRG